MASEVVTRTRERPSRGSLKRKEGGSSPLPKEVRKGRTEIATPISGVLIDSAQKGGQDALTEVIRISALKVMDHIKIHSRASREQAEDLTQDVLMRVYKNLARYKPQPDTTFEAWLFAITGHVVADHFGKRTVQTVDQDVEEAATSVGKVQADFAEDLVGKSGHSELLSRLAALTPEQREVLALEQEGLSMTQIARMKGRSKSAITQLRQRAEKAAQRALGGQKPSQRRMSRQVKSELMHAAESTLQTPKPEEIVPTDIRIDDLETYLSSQVAEAERNLEQHSDDFHKGLLVRAIDRELAFRRLNQRRKPGSDEFIIITIQVLMFQEVTLV